MFESALTTRVEKENEWCRAITGELDFLIFLTNLIHNKHFIQFTIKNFD